MYVCVYAAGNKEDPGDPANEEPGDAHSEDPPTPPKDPTPVAPPSAPCGDMFLPALGVPRCFVEGLPRGRPVGVLPRRATFGGLLGVPTGTVHGGVPCPGMQGDATCPGVHGVPWAGMHGVPSPGMDGVVPWAGMHGGLPTVRCVPSAATGGAVVSVGSCGWTALMTIAPFCCRVTVTS